MSSEFEKMVARSASSTPNDEHEATMSLLKRLAKPPTEQPELNVGELSGWPVKQEEAPQPRSPKSRSPSRSAQPQAKSLPTMRAEPQAKQQAKADSPDYDPFVAEPSRASSANEPAPQDTRARVERGLPPREPWRKRGGKQNTAAHNVAKAKAANHKELLESTGKTAAQQPQGDVPPWRKK